MLRLSLMAADESDLAGGPLYGRDGFWSNMPIAIEHGDVGREAGADFSEANFPGQFHGEALVEVLQSNVVTGALRQDKRFALRPMHDAIQMHFKRCNVCSRRRAGFFCCPNGAF